MLLYDYFIKDKNQIEIQDLQNQICCFLKWEYENENTILLTLLV